MLLFFPLEAAAAEAAAEAAAAAPTGIGYFVSIVFLAPPTAANPLLCLLPLPLPPPPPTATSVSSSLPLLQLSEGESVDAVILSPGDRVVEDL